MKNIRILFSDRKNRYIGDRKYARSRFDYRRSHLIMTEYNDENIESDSNKRYAGLQLVRIISVHINVNVSFLCVRWQGLGRICLVVVSVIFSP